MAVIKILFLSDTHLGFDLPFRPRVQKRRRGPDFFENFQRALQPARRGEVDCVVHGGDILFRSKVPAALVEMAFSPLRELAASGIPVFVVPGNHERSTIPHGLLACDPNIHVFSQPTSRLILIRNTRLLFAGFPYHRKHVRKNFRSLVDQTRWQEESAEVRILCVHHCFEGAKVGPNDYTFRYNHDVIRIKDIPPGFAAVLSGHVHRHQVLTVDLKGRKNHSPVLYSGSTERTSFAEKNETKGYLILSLDGDKSGSKVLASMQFCPLRCRPMVTVKLAVGNMKAADIEQGLRNRLVSIDRDAVVRVEIHGHVRSSLNGILCARHLRSILPETVTCHLIFKDPGRGKAPRNPSCRRSTAISPGS
jgi:DNA repair exonuclease SbcCD nuclease subunit